MKTHTIYICQSCRYSKDERTDDAERSGGSLLHEALARAIKDRPELESVIALKPFNCLMSCDQHSNVYLRHTDKIGYVLGRFTPDRESAEAILDYATKYVESADGTVPFRQWPQSIRGHFIARTPPFSE